MSGLFNFKKFIYALFGVFEGIPGKDGRTPYIGDNENWWIEEVDTHKPSRGPKGVQGNTPYIGSNKNWWINEVDTGILAEGKDGDTPEIGGNGNWWIKGADTGKPSRGEEGIKRFNYQTDNLDDLNSIGKASMYYVVNNANAIVGELHVLGDNMLHTMQQVLIGNYTHTDGVVDWSHVDGQVNILVRVYNINAPNNFVPPGTWGKWSYYNGGLLYEDVKEIDFEL